MTCLKEFVQINSIGGHEAMEFNEDDYLDIEQRQEIRNKARMFRRKLLRYKEA